MLADDFRRLRRGTLDLTQSELGLLLNRTTRSISDYESGAQPVPSEIALAMECLALRASGVNSASVMPKPIVIPKYD